MPKPYIDDVCLVFHQFQQNVIRAMVHTSALSKEQKKDFDKAREELQLKLKELGLSNHINWSERDA